MNRPKGGKTPFFFFWSNYLGAKGGSRTQGGFVPKTKWGS